MYIRATVPSNRERERFAKKLSEVKCVEIKQFVVVTDYPEFCLGTTLLYIDTRNSRLELQVQMKSACMCVFNI